MVSPKCWVIAAFTVLLACVLLFSGLGRYALWDDEAVTALAQARGCTPAQLALAWLLHQGPDIVPIPGTRRIARLDENADAALIDLSIAELRRLDDVLSTHAVAGTRYPAAGMASVNR